MDLNMILMLLLLLLSCFINNQDTWSVCLSLSLSLSSLFVSHKVNDEPCW